MLKGEISMLYKKDDRDDPRNYRPITLLQNVYKIMARVMAKRMQTVVHQFVSGCQKGFVPDVQISDATMLLELIEQYVNDRPMEREGLMVFLDMEKAFDRCSYKYLNGSLKALKFGKYFRSLVGMIYNTEAPSEVHPLDY